MPKRITSLGPADQLAAPATPAPAGRSTARAVHGRFLQLSDVCSILDISPSQTYALVRSGELPAIKIGGRGQWRVELSQLEKFIERMYDETRDFVSTHPFGQGMRPPEQEALEVANETRHEDVGGG